VTSDFAADVEETAGPLLTKLGSFWARSTRAPMRAALHVGSSTTGRMTANYKFTTPLAKAK
jgi:hypothetical protein